MSDNLFPYSAPAERVVEIACHRAPIFTGELFWEMYPDSAARIEINGRRRNRINSLKAARDCADRLIGHVDGVTAERLDVFAEKLLALAAAEIAEIQREFATTVAAAAEREPGAA